MDFNSGIGRECLRWLPPSSLATDPCSDHPFPVASLFHACHPSLCWHHLHRLVACIPFCPYECNRMLHCIGGLHVSAAHLADRRTSWTRCTDHRWPLGSVHPRHLLHSDSHRSSSIPQHLRIRASLCWMDISSHPPSPRHLSSTGQVSILLHPRVGQSTGDHLTLHRRDHLPSVDLQRSSESAIWIRRIKGLGFMYSIHAYRKVLIVCTGAGIAPALPYIKDPLPTTHTHLLWIAKQHEQNYGKEVWSLVEKKYPHVTLHDTSLQGRPGVQLVEDEFWKSESEAVFIVSNEKYTNEVVNGLWKKGIPCFGALFDS